MRKLVPTVVATLLLILGPTALAQIGTQSPPNDGALAGAIDTTARLQDHLGFETDIPAQDSRARYYFGGRRW